MHSEIVMLWSSFHKIEMQDKGRQVNVFTELHKRMNKRRWCAQAGLSKQNSKQGQVSGKNSNSKFLNVPNSGNFSRHEKADRRHTDRQGRWWINSTN